MLRYATVSEEIVSARRLPGALSIGDLESTAATGNQGGDWTSSLMATDDTREPINVTCVLQSCGLPDPALVVTLIARITSCSCNCGR